MKVIAIRGTIVGNDDKWIYDWLDMDATSPRDVENALNEAGGDEVTLIINSAGGLVVAGTEIYQLLKSYAGKVTAHVITACSAATVIACGADETFISRAGMYMIHNVQSYAAGDYRDMKKEARILKDFNKVIINAYMDKTGMTEAELQKLMDDESWMPSDRAIEYGFCDGYIENSKIAPAQDEGLEDYLTDMAANAAADVSGVIPHEKIMELKLLLEKGNARAADKVQNACNSAGSDIKISERRNAMILDEFLAQGSDAKAEFDARVEAAVSAAKAELSAEHEKAVKDAADNAANAENERIKSLDAIAGMVPAESLHEAKYGKDRIDGKEMAYRAALAGQLKAANYLNDAIEDSESAGTGEVGTGDIDAGEASNGVTSDNMAGYINSRKEGK